MRGVNEAHGVTHATRLDVMTMPASSAETIVSDADSLNRDISEAKKRSISDGPAPLSNDPFKPALGALPRSSERGRLRSFTKMGQRGQILIPFTKQQRDELAAVGTELQADHIVALCSDFSAIEAAFVNCLSLCQEEEEQEEGEGRRRWKSSDALEQQ